MHRLVSIPAWMDDVIRARALALDVDYDEALVQSLDIEVVDPMAQSAGWAVAHGERVRTVARRLSHSSSTIEKAAARFEERRRLR